MKQHAKLLIDTIFKLLPSTFKRMELTMCF